MTTPLSITIALLLLALFVANKRRLQRDLPPGPPADPIIGHLRVIPTESQAETFHEWSQTYGDVMYLTILGRKMVVLGSLEAAQELLENRGAKYSCRPRFVMYEMLGWVPSLSFLPYGKQYMKHRKVLQQYFGRKESLGFVHVVAEEAGLLVKNLMHADPSRYWHFIHRFTTSNIMRVTFGHPIKSDDDIFLELGVSNSRVMNYSGPPGSTPIDFFPWLRYFPFWFPGTYYATKAREGYETIRRLYDIPIEFVQKQMMENNTLERSFASEELAKLDLLETPSAEELDLDDIKGAAATIFGAGADTSNATLTVFFLAMVLHPEYQARAYEEIQSVIGSDRLPEYADRESLPFVECIFQETLRWHPTVSLGVPHRLINEDDVYNGFFVPQGTIIIPNIKGMSLDERIYTNPRQFDPSRYLPGRAEPHFTAVWGFGRRICPGRHFADMAIWHAIAYVLATLEIRKAGDGDVKVAFTEGLTSQAVPFKFEVAPRSESTRMLLARIEGHV